MAWLPQVRAQRLLRDVYAQASNPKSGKRFAFDILVVDEAHHVAPSSPPAIAGGRGYAVDTQRTVAVRQLADKCEHRLFLSRHPAQRPPGVVHRAAGDDRLPPVLAVARCWTPTALQGRHRPPAQDAT